MGTWGIGIFENDDALDWIDELGKIQDTFFLFETFERILQPGQYLEASDCSRALAAAEVVAAFRNQDLSKIPEPGIVWIRSQKIEDINKHIELSKRAIELIKIDSELGKLWEEEGRTSEWEKVLAELETRLK